MSQKVYNRQGLRQDYRLIVRQEGEIGLAPVF